MSSSMRKQAIARHFAHANQYNKHAHIQEKICELLTTKVIKHHHAIDNLNPSVQNRLQKHAQNKIIQNVLEIGAGQGLLTQKLTKEISAIHWFINELCLENKLYLQSILPTAEFYFGDAEGLCFLDTVASQTHKAHTFDLHMFDLIVSANTVQWFDNPLGFVDDAVRYLKRGGQLLFNSFTPNNFVQIKQLTGQGLNYPDTQSWLAKLNEYDFSDIQVSTHAYELTFTTPYEVLKHIKNTGVSVNVNDSFRWTRQSLKEFERAYKQHFSTENGQVLLSYEALVISAVR